MSYRLTYFNGRGKAECLRYIFALAEQEYEDIRVPFTDPYPVFSGEWQTLKPNTLWGSLPELEYKGHRLCQTPTIARFLGAQFGLGGKTDIEQAKVDMIISCIEDIFAALGVLNRIPRDKREPAKKEEQPKFQAWMAQLNKLLKMNNDGKGWFIGDKATVGDVYAYSMSCFVTHHYPDILSEHNELREMFERFEKLPQIAEWIAKRPKTAF